MGMSDAVVVDWSRPRRRLRTRRPPRARTNRLSDGLDAAGRPTTTARDRTPFPIFSKF